MGGDNIIVYVFVIYFFTFIAVLTPICWLFSKKFPVFWEGYKYFCGICLLFIGIVFCGVVGQKYYETFPSSIFARNWGYHPTSNIKDLQVSTTESGDHTYVQLNFKTDRETVNKVLNDCFYEISEDEIKDLNDENIKEFLGSQQSHYYERPERDIKATGCIGDFTYKLIAYNDLSGKVYFYRRITDY